MPRNGSGTFTLVTGNPVVSGTIIESTWANNTLADIADSITNSLARNGEGGMTAPLRLVDGTVSVPGLAFANETGSGLYRAAAGDIGLSVLGSRILRVQAAGATVTGTLTTGNLVVDDNSTLGSSNTDTLAVNARITTDLEPNDNNAKDIGTSGRNWRDGFFGRNLSVGGTLGVAGATNLATSSGNVGIGTASPAFKLDVAGTGSIGGDLDVAGSVFRKPASGTGYLIYGSNGATNNGVYYDQANSAVSLWTVSNQRLTVNSSGNVGIGIDSPSYRLQVRREGGAGSLGISVDSVGSVQRVAQYFSVGDTTSATTGHVFYTRNGTATDNIAVLVDNSGNMFVGKTTAAFTTQGTVIGPNGEMTLARTGSDTVLRFASTNTGALVGSVSITTTTTTYNTSSDYRLKENVAPMTGALEKVAALKPVTYTWKADGSNGQGFIAHELQAVVPDCVTGAKDAVERLGNILDADGKVLQENVQEPTEEGRVAGQTWLHTKDSPRYQGVDTSFLVATLVAAIQELKAEVDALKSIPAA
jgi:Chaperone of endosialidase